jgi:hypothetical protein
MLVSIYSTFPFSSSFFPSFFFIIHFFPFLSSLPSVPFNLPPHFRPLNAAYLRIPLIPVSILFLRPTSYLLPQDEDHLDPLDEFNSSFNSAHDSERRTSGSSFGFGVSRF